MGPFNPSLGYDYSGPYQNFDITIPATTPSGQADLAVADFELVWVSFYMFPSCLGGGFLTSALVA